MKTSLQDSFDAVLDSLSLPEPVLLAVSGGVDSMVMAHLFVRSPHRWRVAIAHCNFRLRGEESDLDEALVEEWAESHGVRLHIRGFDTLSYASSHGLSVEMAARELRYAWFDSLCRDFHYKCVAVAHHSDDNAETLVLNLLRGTGLKGISGMKTVSTLPVEGSQVPLIRPLLSFSRSGIEDFARSTGIPYRCDSTNAGTDFKRNKVRNAVFPVFEEINPSFRETFRRDMACFSQAGAIADDYFAEALPSVLRESGPGVVLRADIPALTSHKHWKYLLFRILEPYSFNASTIDDLAALIQESLGGGGVTLSGKRFFSPACELVTSSSELLILERGAEEAAAPVRVDGPGEYSCAGVHFRVAERPFSQGEGVVCPRGILLFDASRLTFPFIVRPFSAGDWLRPLGMRGRKKLSDLFVDLKYSASDKRRALVVLCPGEDGNAPLSDGEGRACHVAALLGERIDDYFKVTSGTAAVISVSLEVL